LASKPDRDFEFLYSTPQSFLGFCHIAPQTPRSHCPLR
jgi:hypothetical protein